MDIAEKRLPQDGGFTVRVDERLIDLRVSTIPTIFGEKVVIRILDKSRVPLEFAKLGFFPKVGVESNLKSFAYKITPYGVWIATITV